jgi:TonB-linked SusC/RagA family outer membrane protein
MKKLMLFLLALFAGVYVSAQTTVSGIVSSNTGETLPGVSVLIKGTASGSASDIDGRFSVTFPSERAVLVFTYIGYKAKEVVVTNGSKNLYVVLDEDNQLLDEVVVVGYGTMKKSDLTGSVASLAGSKLSESIVTNVDQILQGRVAGVQVQANSGAPGAANSIRIRGASSVTNSNEPLYIIDGIPVSGAGSSFANFEWSGGSGGQNIANPLAAIAPSDIVSINVLKDASATAIYGSAGANGVVIVTTKRGEKGQTSITYDGYAALQTRAKKLSYMDLPEFATYQMQLYDEGFLPNVDATYVDPFILGKGTDWQDAVTRNAWMQSHNLSVTGGNETTNYAASLGYMGQDGVLLNSDFERYTGRLNLDSKYGKYFQWGGSISFAQTSENIINNDGINGIVMQSLMMRPDVSVYDINGNYANPETTEQGSSIFNPVAMATEVTNNFKRQRVMGNAYAQLNFTKGFNYRTEFGFDSSNSTMLGFKPNYDYGQFRNAMIMNREEHNMYWLWKNLINYNLNIQKHNVNLMVGSETSASSWNGTQLIKDHLTSNDIKVLGNDGAFLSNNGWAGDIHKVSFFGRANYNYADKYLLTATMRADGSSRFGSNNRWGYFPSFAAAWRFSNEEFLSGMEDWLHNGKLRLGYGQNGNDNIGNYLYGSTMQSLTTVFGTGYRMNNNANPDLKWETSVQYNTGLDLGFFDGRIDLSVDVYYKTTNDLLLQPSVSPVLGGSTYLDIATATQNIGKVDNKGIDISLNTYNIDNKDFKWNTNIVFSLNRNKVVELDNFGTPIYPANVQQMIFLGGYNQASVIKVGQPIGVFYGWVADGLYKDAEDLKNSPKPAGATIDRNSGVWVGDMKFKDISGPDGVPDGVIDDYDQTIIGDPNPDFTFGFNNIFTYKEWELNIGLTGSIGGDIFNIARLKREHLNIAWDPQSPDVLNRALLSYYDGDNTNTANADNCYITNLDQNPTIPRFSTNDGANNNRMSDRWIEDGSYLRIQNISLAYNLPSVWIKKVGLQKAKVYFNAQNVWTFTNYSGLDPEIGSFNQMAGVTNFDCGRYPSPRVYTLGVNVTF